MTDAVLATTKTMRTLADGGMTVTLEIAPQHFDEAFRLFGRSGTSVGIAAVTPDAAQRATREAMPEPSPVEDIVGDDPPRERRGFMALPRAQQAALRCNEPDFWRFLEVQLTAMCGSTISGITTKEQAAEAVRDLCNVPSRRVFDQSDAGAKLWDGLDAAYFAWAHGRR